MIVGQWIVAGCVPVEPAPSQSKPAVWATMERLRRGGAAIVELTRIDDGSWAGNHLVEIRSQDPDRLYEACYQNAAAHAAIHGCRLDRFREIRS